MQTAGPEGEPTRIGVIVDREGLGDALLKLPMLRAIKRARPDGELWWMANHTTVMADVLRVQTQHLVDKVVTGLDLSESVQGSLPRLRELPPFDLVFDTRTRVLGVALARIFLRHREFYACLPGFLLSTRRPAAMWARPRGIGARAMSMAIAAFGTTADGSGSLPVSDAAQAIAAHDLPPGPRYIGLAPGSREARKNWPLGRYAEVAAALAADGHVPVFILGPFERPWLAELRASVPAALFPEIEPIDRTLALIARLALVVANDSGMGHMTAALGVPLVSLFGPTKAERWRPFGGDVRVVRAQDFGGKAMDAIPVEAVLAAVRRKLEGMQPAAGGAVVA